MSEKSKISGIWQGYLSGTNRAKVVVRIQAIGNGLKGKAIAFDHQFGSTIADLDGKLDGQKAHVRLLNIHARAPMVALDGEIMLNFDEAFTVADGNWSTDLGTAGMCKIMRSNEWDVHWFWRLRRIKLGWFIMRWRNTVYCIFLLAVAVAALLQRVQIAWQTLILLLLPAPFLFSPHMGRLLAVFHGAKVKKIGPIELEQTSPSPEVLAAASPNVQESVAFNELNRFFVLRTKILMGILAHGNGMSLAEFSQYTRAFAVAPENVEMTLAAILQTGCAQLVEDNKKIIPTAWGQRYVRFGLKLA